MVSPGSPIYIDIYYPVLYSSKQSTTGETNKNESFCQLQWFIDIDEWDRYG